MANPDNNNPAKPSTDAPTPEDTRRATQENQDANRPDQQQRIPRKDQVVNDNSDPRYALTDTEETELPHKEYENQEDRIDDLKNK
ncbi:hypothetical protein [Devosia sp. RR2S18]|jgi:hypothetical protein|uniref:hypothetical protein n=1 Tax=Devosia rhizosphaerae TaxID=3049774 RepID=UPI00254229A9|nr:hypothetical protein [Devosia sp. RR2S18]WIJ23441.1 hypothetical protein QOV41_10100 [Devosia sp. RR2S18]